MFVYWDNDKRHVYSDFLQLCHSALWDIVTFTGYFIGIMAFLCFNGIKAVLHVCVLGYWQSYMCVYLDSDILISMWHFWRCFYLDTAVLTGLLIRIVIRSAYWDGCIHAFFLSWDSGILTCLFVGIVSFLKVFSWL